MVVDSIVGYLGGFAPVGVLAFRNVYGWAVNSFADGKIQKYELVKLIQMLLKVGSLAILLHLGLDLNGLNSTAVAALIDAVRTDVVKPLLLKKK